MASEKSAVENGAELSTVSAPFVVVRVEVSGPSSKVLFNQFIRSSILRSCSTWDQIWKEVVCTKLNLPKESLFGLKKATVSGRGGEFCCVDVDLKDDPNGILDMGVTSVLYEGEMHHSPQHRPEKRHDHHVHSSSSSSSSSNGNMMFIPSQPSFPEFKDNSRPAYSKLLSDIRAQLMKDGCVGFTDPIQGKRQMLKLVKTLYSLSTFHDVLAKKLCIVPAYFAFSKGVDDFRSKKNKAPVLTHAKVLQAKQSLSCLLIEPLINNDKSWEPFRNAIETFVQELDKVLPELALDIPRNDSSTTTTSTTQQSTSTSSTISIPTTSIPTSSIQLAIPTPSIPTTNASDESSTSTDSSSLVSSSLTTVATAAVAAQVAMEGGQPTTQMFGNKRSAASAQL
mmetsp:Transcript_22769/g.29716  ORF Transcript_22769/g.29716 Transcript_22769/m.29716 type:complete len:395 (+) Transcript_22769:30-1214(+)